LIFDIFDMSLAGCHLFYDKHQPDPKLLLKMKKIRLLVFSILACCTLANAQPGKVYMFSYFKNNGEDGLHMATSKDGLVWTALNKDSSLLRPAVGNEKLMRDPCIIEGRDGYFHMVWTASWKDKGIGYSRSKDLVNWSEQQFIPVMQQQPGALNCWAPEITYDRKSREYIIYWATTIPGKFAVTDASGDEKYNHRLYYVTTKDFVTFTQAKLLYDKGFNVIDATIVPNVKGYLMFLKDETLNPVQKNIRVATSDRATGPFSKPSLPITGTSYWAEGPTATRIKDKWIVYFDKYTKHTMGAVQSSDGKHWQDISAKVKFPAGTRHGTVFTISAKQLQILEHALEHK
jgi:hypothetical protein